MADYDNILFEKKGHLAYVTINRPERRNAIDPATSAELKDAFEAFKADDDLWVAILTGAGDKAFSAGADLLAMSQSLSGKGGDAVAMTAAFAGITRGYECWKPIIAAIHGYCLAGGSELATCCDLVYVADDAQMGYPAVRFGVPDNHFHAWFIGMRKAMEMMITGDSLSGRECVRLGWANDCFPLDQLEEKVLAVALRIASVPPDLVQINKRVVHRQMEIMGLHTGIRVGSELCALGTHQKSLHEVLAQTREKGLKGALQSRDEPFGDYRTRHTGDDES